MSSIPASDPISERYDESSDSAIVFVRYEIEKTSEESEEAPITVLTITKRRRVRATLRSTISKICGRSSFGAFFIFISRIDFSIVVVFSIISGLFWLYDFTLVFGAFFLKDNKCPPVLASNCIFRSIKQKSNFAKGKILSVMERYNFFIVWW